MIPQNLHIAAVVRHRIVAVVVLGNGMVIDVARTVITGSASDHRAQKRIVGLAADYRVQTLLVEPASRLCAPLAGAALTLQERSLASASERLLRERANQQRLTHHILDRLPVLSRFMNRLMISSHRWFPDRHRLVIILAAAIALAEQTNG